MEKDVEEILLGYDIRFGPEQYVNLFWNQEMREPFLLIPNIKWPLSVQTDAWPSVFTECKKYSSLLKLRRIPVEGIYYEGGVPQYDDLLNFWQDKDVMKNYYFKHKYKSLKDTVLISVVIKERENYLKSEASKEGSNDRWCSHLYPSLPKNVNFRNWIFLGYDIADRYKGIGLIGFSYKEVDKPELLRKTWDPRLNEYGLFKVWEDAVEFREFINKEIKFHAPFFVYKLYKDPDFHG